MRSRPILALVFTAAALTGCEDSTSANPSYPVSFIGTSFTLPATIWGSVRNDSESQLYMYPCHPVPELRSGDTWVQQELTVDHECAAVEDVLGSGQSRSFAVTFGSGMPAGLYRLRFNLYRASGGGDPVDVVSREFTVE